MQRTSLDELSLVDLAGALGGCLATGDMVLLEGAMGAGKTTFARALGVGLELERPERVCSPTFNICMVHAGPVAMIHVDLYRLGDGCETGVGKAAFEALGLGDLELTVQSGGEMAPQGGVLVVEWAELWSGAPADVLRVRIQRQAGASARSIFATAGGPRSAVALVAWAARSSSPEST